MNATNKWPFPENKEFTKKILSPGRYPCVLYREEPVEVDKTDWSTGSPVKIEGQKETKIVFEFIPVNVETAPDEKCAIAAFCRPAQGKKSDMVKVLSQLSPDGLIPDDIRSNVEKLQNYAQSFVGETFMVTCAVSKSGKSNFFVSAYPDNSIVVPTHLVPKEIDESLRYTEVEADENGEEDSDEDDLPEWLNEKTPGD